MFTTSRDPPHTRHMARVLIVGDHLDGRCDLAATIRDAGHAVTHVDSVSSTMTRLAAHEADVVLLNARLDLSAHAVRDIRRLGVGCIVFGARPEVGDVVRAIKAGANDYLTTAANVSDLRSAIQSSAATPRPALSGSSYECFVAVDPVTAQLAATLDRVAALDSPILITGETGTGKESAARRIHRSSTRARGVFLPVNCGTLSEALIDSELFGHRRGAFTGAVTDSTGVIEAAAGGTLFLDEIGELPPSLQAHLLRFLDSREVRRIGESRIRHVDVRVIAATNRDLRADIRSGRFRSDLFYRLNVLSIRLPPLRDRPADIPDLARLSLRAIAARLTRPDVDLSPSAIAVLQSYRWPGNIRELQNVMEQAFANATRTVIDDLDLPDFDNWEDEEPAARPACVDLEDIASTLARYGGHQSRAARALGISRTTLWRRRKQVTGNTNGTSFAGVDSL